MLYYLIGLVAIASLLSFAGVLAFKATDILLSGGFLVLVSYASNKLFAYVFRTTPNPESALITGLILALIVGPLAPFASVWVLAAIAVVAMASKYLLVINKRHILNPTAFAVVVSALLLKTGASWWVGNQFLVPFIILGGVLVVGKIRRWHLALSFLLTYFAALFVGSAFSPAGIGTFWPLLKSLVLYSPLLFFTFVMLIEPLTGPQNRLPRIYFGVFVALVLIAVQRYTQVPYSLELALLVGNVGSRIFSRDIRLVLRLRETMSLSKDTVAFWFEPERPFVFTAGQFLEWTLPHSHPDSRGIRRYFTIASAPSEKGILLVTKFVEVSSSFKKALKDLKPGQKIIASNKEGEFVVRNKTSRHLVFIAGGIGVTPFRSIIRDILDRGQKVSITLLYASRSPEEFVFGDLFQEASEKIGLKIVRTTTDSQSAGSAWKGKTGRIDSDMIKSEVPNWQDCLFYVSGPDPMVVSYKKMLQKMGVASHNIKTDFFTGYSG